MLGFASSFSYASCFCGRAFRLKHPHIHTVCAPSKSSNSKLSKTLKLCDRTGWSYCVSLSDALVKGTTGHHSAVLCPGRETPDVGSIFSISWCNVGRPRFQHMEVSIIMGVSSVPPIPGWFTMDNPTKMDDLGGTPIFFYFGKPPYFKTTDTLSGRTLARTAHNWPAALVAGMWSSEA